jgi:hypothetical protein
LIFFAFSHSGGGPRENSREFSVRCSACPKPESGLAQPTIAGREWLVAVAPLEDGLVIEMLRYADELRDPAEYFDKVPTAKSQKDMVDLPVPLIAKKSGAFDPKKFEDHYGTALKELRAAGGNVVDLMEALKRSIEGAAPQKAKGGAWREEAGLTLSESTRCSRRDTACANSESPSCSLQNRSLSSSPS